MRRNNVALRLQESLLIEAKRVAETEGRRVKSVHQRGRGREVVGAAHRRLFPGTRGTGERGGSQADSSKSWATECAGSGGRTTLM